MNTIGQGTISGDASYRPDLYYINIKFRGDKEGYRREFVVPWYEFYFIYIFSFWKWDKWHRVLRQK